MGKFIVWYLTESPSFPSMIQNGITSLYSKRLSNANAMQRCPGAASIIPSHIQYQIFHLLRVDFVFLLSTDKGSALPFGQIESQLAIEPPGGAKGPA